MVGKPSNVDSGNAKFSAIALSLSLLLIAGSPSRTKAPVVLTPAEEARVLLVAPRPEYPIQARRVRVSGSGWFQMIVSKAGYVTEVRVIKSTGSKILDAAAIQALLKWRFKTGTGIERANQPITFRL